MTVDLRFLLAFDQEGGSGGKKKLANFSTQMLSLHWLLHVRAGLHIALPATPLRSLWSAYSTAMREIQVKTKKGTFDLESMVLLPASPQSKESRINFMKICRASSRKTPIFLAFEVPDERPAVNLKGKPFLDFAHIFDVSVRSEQTTFDRNFIGRYNHAYMRCKSDGKVIAFGYAMPRTYTTDAGKPRAYADIRHLAYLPLNTHLAPVPTRQHVKMWEDALETGTPYSVLPSEDPLLSAAIKLATYQRKSSTR